MAKATAVAVTAENDAVATETSAAAMAAVAGTVAMCEDLAAGLTVEKANEGRGKGRQVKTCHFLTFLFPTPVSFSGGLLLCC